jgi:hypothetical protein
MRDVNTTTAITVTNGRFDVLIGSLGGHDQQRQKKVEREDRGKQDYPGHP